MSFRPTGFTDFINAVEYGVVPSAVVNFADMTGNTVTLISGGVFGPLFTVADVGKAILIQTAGVNGADLWTTVTGFTSTTVVTTSASAAAPVFSTTTAWGRNANIGGFPSFVDQVPNLTSAINAAAAANTGLYVSSGTYCYGSVLTFGPVGVGGLDIADTMTAFVGSGTSTFFIAQNPASATPGGLINMVDLFITMSRIGDFSVLGASMPTVGSLTPGAELILWVGNCVIENIQIFSTSFFRGIHLRLTNGVVSNLLDFGISSYEMDGGMLNDCSASAATFSLDERDNLGGGALGGIVNGFTAANYNPNNTIAYDKNGTASLTHVNVRNSFTLSSVATSVSGTAVYTGTITGGAANAYAGFTFIVAGFTGANNGTFLCMASTATTLTLNNSFATAEAAAATATVFGGGILTITAPNTFQAGQRAIFYNVVTATFLNGQTVQVVTASAAQFTVLFTHANYDAADTGTATSIGLLALVTCDGVQPPQGMNPTGFYSCIASPGNGNNVPIGFQTAQTMLINCVPENFQIGYVSGSGSVLYNCVDHQMTLADFVSSEGQIPWAATIVYYGGQYVVDPAGHKQTVVVGGTSGGSMPAWNDAGGTTTDNTVTWQDGGVFAGVLAVYVKYSGCGVNGNGGSISAYPWWNAALNADGDFNLSSLGGAGMYSTQSPVLLTGLTATFTNKILYTLSGSQQGKFLIDYYITTTTAGTGGTVSLSFAWTDIGGNAQTFTVGAALDLTSVGAAGRIAGILPVYAKGANITCTATVAGATGNPVFAAAISARSSL